eukprot:GSA120T00019762001.1
MPTSAESGAVDGEIKVSGGTHQLWRVQEKVLTARTERGKQIGLRCPLRRASGKPYSDSDADFLLLHCRTAPEPNQFGELHGSALIPWHVLVEGGYVATKGTRTAAATAGR